MSGAPAEFALDQPPSDGISQVVWANSSDLLLASSWDRTLRLYDVTHNVCRLQVEHAGAVLDCCFDANDTRAFAVGMDQHVTAVDLATGARNVLGSHSGVSRCVVSHVESQSLFSGGWDGRLLGWDARQSKQTASTTPHEGARVLTLALSGNRLVVGTSKRHVLIYDLRNLSTPEQRRESSLMNQTRCIRGFPDTTGYALSSIEGRVAIEYFNPEPAVQKNKYAFKVRGEAEGERERNRDQHTVARARGVVFVVDDFSSLPPLFAPSVRSFDSVSPRLSVTARARARSRCCTQ